MYVWANLWTFTFSLRPPWDSLSTGGELELADYGINLCGHKLTLCGQIISPVVQSSSPVHWLDTTHLGMFVCAFKLILVCFCFRVEEASAEQQGSVLTLFLRLPGEGRHPPQQHGLHHALPASAGPRPPQVGSNRSASLTRDMRMLKFGGASGMSRSGVDTAKTPRLLWRPKTPRQLHTLPIIPCHPLGGAPTPYH